MTSSLIALAEQLDGLALANKALVSECEKRVTVAMIAAGDALAVMAATQALGWELGVFDSEHNVVVFDDIIDDFAPFRLDITKPSGPAHALSLLTCCGFSQWLSRAHPATQWRLARLRTCLPTLGRLYCDWSSVQTCTPAASLISPSRLVKETALQGRAPADIRPWLLLPSSLIDLADPAHRVWAGHAFDALASSLANEIDGHDQSLVFRGPPQLKLARAPLGEVHQPSASLAFAALQAATFWVYENAREASLRHALLAVAIAQAGHGADCARRYLDAHICAALDNARIAYQLSLSEITRDTLVLLSGLRKEVGEETTRATEATRQTAVAVTTALTIGTGFAAAQLSLAIQPWVVCLVMTAIATCFVLVACSSGSHIFQQRQLRADWKARLYRFLTETDYQKMVEGPCTKAERVFTVVTVVGLIAVLGMCVGVSVASLLEHSRITPRHSAVLPAMPAPSPPRR